MHQTFSIRRAAPADLPLMRRIFAEARQKMRAAGNPSQWPESYPSDALLLADMEQGHSYLVEQGGRPVATFVLALGTEPTYARIYGGAWADAARPYATLHRLASLSGVRGVAACVIGWCAARTDNLRADTHRDNRPMQHILLKHGFARCGTIRLANGEERWAYQRV